MVGQGQHVAVTSSLVNFRVITRTDTGLVRSNNEDTVVLGDLTTGASGFSGRLGPGGLIVGVCDGMGGEAAGEIASRIAADSVRKVMALAQIDLDDDGFGKALAIAVELAGKAVKDYAAENPKCERMGTTCTVGALRRTHMVVGHVGDSRAYLLRGGALRQLTRDQNLANEMLQRGQITKEQVPEVVHGKHITQAVGNTDSLKVDVEHVDLASGDRVLICSDGLSDMLDDRGISEVLSGSQDLEAQADELVARAKRAGGRDNISLVLVEVVAASEAAGLEAAAHVYPVTPASSAAEDTAAEYRLPVSRRPLMAGLAVVALALGLALWVRGRGGRTESARSSSETTVRAHDEVQPSKASIEVPPKERDELPVAEHTTVHAPDVVSEGFGPKPKLEERVLAPGKSTVRAPSPPSKPVVEVEDAVRPPSPSNRNPF